MPAKKSTRKKITAAARSLAGKVVKAVKAAPGSLKKVARKSLASARTAVAKKTTRATAKKTSAKKSPGALRAQATPKIKSTVFPVSQPAAAPAPAAAAPHRTKLPEAYGTKQLFLIARDPRWLFAQWDFTTAELRTHAKRAAGGHLTLRIFKDALPGVPVAEAKLPVEARHWFVPVGEGETCYVAEIGYQRKPGGWESLAISRPAATPPDTIAPDMAGLMATIPPDVPFQEVMRQFGASLAKNLPLIEAIEQVRATGWDGRPAVTTFPAGQRWTPRQARELARLAGAQSICNRIATELAGLSSADILREIPAAAELPQPTPAASGPAAPPSRISPDALAAESALSSPAGGWSGTLT